MCHPLFLKITNAVKEFDPYFMQKANAVGRLGLHPLVKTIAALRMLAYGEAGDCNDGYLQLQLHKAIHCHTFLPVPIVKGTFILVFPVPIIGGPRFFWEESLFSKCGDSKLPHILHF
jgi:hypothetical protein